MYFDKLKLKDNLEKQINHLSMGVQNWSQFKFCVCDLHSTKKKKMRKSGNHVKFKIFNLSPETLLHCVRFVIINVVLFCFIA